MPAYNRAALIAKAIQSVIQQTFSDFEIIIIDDGSTDDTGDVIRSGFSTESRIKYYRKDNEERGAARNFGLQRANGKFAVFFDSDDLMKPHYLQTLYNIISGSPGIRLLACKYNFISIDGRESDSYIQPVKEGWYGRDYFLQGNVLACNFCVRIEGVEYIPFPPERELASMEDWLFILLNTEGNKVFIKDEVCLSMLQHDERSMGNNQKVIAVRRQATEWIENNISLDYRQLKVLRAWSHYFCGIHQYLDYKSRRAVKEGLRAIQLNGINGKFIFLIIKSLVGRRLIERLK